MRSPPLGEEGSIRKRLLEVTKKGVWPDGKWPELTGRNTLPEKGVLDLQI